MSSTVLKATYIIKYNIFYDIKIIMIIIIYLNLFNMRPCQVNDNGEDDDNERYNYASMKCHLYEFTEIFNRE